MVSSAHFALALGGGALIGLSTSMALLVHGRVAGISGIFASALRAAADRTFALPFLLGLVVPGLLLAVLWPGGLGALGVGAGAPHVGVALVAGALVGFGTRLGGGCTSGHGICGMARLSRRSIAATGTFMAAGIATAFVVHHVVQAAP